MILRSFFQQYYKINFFNDLIALLPLKKLQVKSPLLNKNEKHIKAINDFTCTSLSNCNAEFKRQPARMEHIW